MFSPNLQLEGTDIIFHGIPQVKPLFRTVRELKPVIRACSLPEDEVIYAVYRDIKTPAHAGMFMKHSLRFDLTVVFPKMLGKEYAKTLGHYHSLCKTASYTEVYEVLSGNAGFILQKADGNVVTDIVSIQADKGEIVIIPPDYGHVTVNTGKKVLVVSNLQSSMATADYSEIIKLKGAAYFLTINGPVKNPNYQTPALRPLKAAGLKERFFSSKGQLYDIFLGQPEKFGFLSNPEGHPEVTALVH